MQAYQFQQRRRVEGKNVIWIFLSIWNSVVAFGCFNQSCIEFLIETKFCQKGFAANLDGE